MQSDEIHKLIEYFCNQSAETKPSTRKEYEDLLTRMANIGMIDHLAIKSFLSGTNIS